MSSKFFMQSAAGLIARASARLDGASRAASASCLAKARQLDTQGIAILAVAAAVLVGAADPAFAQASGGGGGAAITGFLQNLVNLMTGTAGKLIAVIAICIVGIGALMGALSLRAAGGVVLGVMLLFSSAWIVDQIIA